MSPLIVIIAAVCAVIGLAIGSSRGHPVWGFFLGLVLSVIGIVIIACTKPSPEYLAQREAARMRAQRDAAAILDAEDRNRPGG